MSSYYYYYNNYYQRPKPAQTQRQFHQKNSLRSLSSLPFTSLHAAPFSLSACSAPKTPRSDLVRKPGVQSKEEEGKGEWVDWEDEILEETLPLVGFVRMVLHSGKYQIGDRLTPEHERIIVERLLAYHPESQKKIGCGIDYITLGYHPDFDSSKCLFIVRKDGELVDFSYWKCIKGLVRKNYPLYAESFIHRHFRRGRQSR